MYAERSKSQLWSIVERYTTDRENSIIKEIFINNRTMAAVAREQGVTRFLFGTNQGHLHFTDIF
jgi:DNA-directed RNA polymerase sigma subunit (sigma70/sigma32)